MLEREGRVAGELYTPSPLVRLLTKIGYSKIGESILDPYPSCGPCGFLIESIVAENNPSVAEGKEFDRHTVLYLKPKLSIPI